MAVFTDILYLVLVTCIPALELRASIPLGIFGMGEDLSWPFVAGICLVSNVVLGFAVFWIMAPVFNFLRRWRWFDRRIWPLIERTRSKVQPFVDKYGELGVAVFIGIPLPGSGVYTGALGSYLLGLKKRKFAVANVIGVLIAAIAVTTLCLLIDKGFVGGDSWWAKLFLKKEH